VADACTFPVLAANFVIESFVSDDGFKNFRAWFVSNGLERFTNAIKNPESIADWLQKEDVDEIDGESMLEVAQDVYEELFEDDFLDRITFIPDPKMKQDWPDSKSEYRKKWPRLVDKFWNQERIREMHTD